MALTKNPEFDLKLKFRRITEISLIITLCLLIAAFKFFPDIQSENIVIESPRGEISIDDIPVTKQEIKIPPKIPTAPIYQQTDEDIEELEIDWDVLEADDIIEKALPLIKDEEEEESDEYVEFFPVEDQPEIIGGIGSVLKVLEYPAFARRAGIQGTVIIFAYLDKKGKIDQLEIAKDPGGGLGEAAAKAVRKVKFRPGKQRGKSVKCKVAIPVKFKLN